MKILLYNTNSFGGNYEYSLALARAYQVQDQVESVQVIVPKNADAEGRHIRKVLKPDVSPYRNPLCRKVNFLYRSVFNPLSFYRLLKKENASVVIFNDFDQISALIWAPFFRKLRRKHLFAAILHDPDRDKFLPSRWLSALTMRQVMSVMNIAFYHGFLPSKDYYERPGLVKQLVPHGIYPPALPDASFLQQILSACKGFKLLGILGNIREEKNYILVLETLKRLPDCMLLVAGELANSGVREETYINAIQELGINNRVIWIRKYLTDKEMNAAIIACDVILLYYKSSFKSQSGILNKIAPYNKRLVVSNIESSLTSSVRSNGIGVIAEPENTDALEAAICVALSLEECEVSLAWQKYSENASWEGHVKLAIDCFKKRNLS